MKQTLLFLSLILSISCYCQTSTPTVTFYDDPAMITADQKDTVKIVVVYMDTTSCKQVRKDSRGRIVETWYQLCNPALNTTLAYGVRLKNDACELVLSNDHRDVHQVFTFFDYLDYRTKKPMNTKFIVLGAWQFNYQIQIPDTVMPTN